MWYAITAGPAKRSKKQERKEYAIFTAEIVISSSTITELHSKIQASLRKYPDQMKRYMQAGIKIVEAGSAREAKRKAKKIDFYFTETGQYGFF